MERLHWYGQMAIYRSNILVIRGRFCVQYFLLQLHVQNTNIIGVYLTGVYLTGVHLIGVYLIGVYFMQNVYSCTIDCTHSAMLGIFPAP
jgi:hypothetical protein